VNVRESIIPRILRQVHKYKKEIDLASLFEWKLFLSSGGILVY